MPYVISEERRDQYRETSIRSQQRKRELLRGDRPGPTADPIDERCRLDVNGLMPVLPDTGLVALSLFSGGGGLDLGFEHAGFRHAAAIELLDICGQTLALNRPDWEVHSGSEAGDVTQVAFSRWRGVDLVHGGPPCQPFSTAGKQAGPRDPRNMWPELLRAIRLARPRAFVAENVPGLLDRKFADFVEREILGPLRDDYTVFRFRLSADDFGVPQSRKRVFFVGFRSRADAARFVIPVPTHGDAGSLFGDLLPRNLARASLGLPDIGWDAVAPTLRSGFTGPRKTTGVVNSRASLSQWARLGIWPSGVQPSRDLADRFVPENGHWRMAIEDCALLQGFPPDWRFAGAVYQALGQIGNSVCPPVGYAVASAVARALVPGR
jgi:DNA (cytosine-5)-methyltransferase 1